MASPDVSELSASTSDWGALTEPQKMEHLISRLRLWIVDSAISADEVECALDIALSAIAITRAHRFPKVGAGDTAPDQKAVA